jgi:hypothetical protein
MRLTKMTTRRWMLTVAAVAILVTVLIEAENSWKRHSNYVSALRAFHAYQGYYDEGRATLNQSVERSRRLMEAELASCATSGQQVAAIKAHLGRASSLIQQEVNFPLGMHEREDDKAYEIATARESLLECQARLNKLIRPR